MQTLATEERTLKGSTRVILTAVERVSNPNLRGSLAKKAEVLSQTGVVSAIMDMMKTNMGQHS